MPFRDQFKRLKADWDKFSQNSQQGQQQQQQQQQQPTQYYPNPHPQSPYGGPQPPNASSYNAVAAGGGPPQYGEYGQQQQFGQPPQQPINNIYWQPRFEPGFPVTEEWVPKEGNNNGWGNNELENYTKNPENAFFTNDRKLIVRAIANNSSSDAAHKYTSARLVSKQTLARDRGCLTAVLSLPCASGIWPAFWLLPFEPFAWPGDGEVDIAETWNGDRNNKSCLHWGQFTAEDAWKHRTQGTQIDEMDRRPVRFDWIWDQTDKQYPGKRKDDHQGGGRTLWYIDGRPVMKATVPGGTRDLKDFQILLNVAMGGNVCGGQIPRDGGYDLVVHALYMSENFEMGGWDRVSGDWQHTPDGNTM